MSENPQTQTQATAAQVPEQGVRGPDQVSASQPTRRRAESIPEPTGWVGWVVFGAMMMVMVGSFQIIAGFTSLFKSGYYLVPKADLLVTVDYTAWGWTHMIIGAIAIAAGLGLLAGQMWARVVGIGIALVSALVNMAFMAAYPLWSITMIALDVLVIYAIAMHGKEMKSKAL